MAATTLPTPKRREVANPDSVWKIPHKVEDQRLYDFWIYHNPMVWDFHAKRPEKVEDPWPDLGEYVPSMLVARNIPGVGGERAAKSAFPGSFGPSSRRAGLEAKGFIRIDEDDPRLPADQRGYVYELAGVAGKLYVLPWDEVEPMPNGTAAWHVDMERMLAFQRALIPIVPRMTIAAHNGLMDDLKLQRERRRERASRSNMAEAVFKETDEIVKQAERTWDHYVATQAPTAVRVKPTARRGA